MKKILTIVGTRPELIKLCLVIKELDQHFCHRLAHTGQNFDYELNEIFFKDLGIRRPDHFLETAATTPMETIANVLVKTDQLITKENPDGILIYGDTNSALAALAAKRRKIPIFHMEAGNRCFDSRVPEEINRKIVDHLSDINMPLTEQGRFYLIQEGIPAQNILKTGSCLPEILNHFESNIHQSSVLSRLKLTPKSYFLISCHREENVDDKKRLTTLMRSLNSLAEKYQLPIIFSVHPRTSAKLKEVEILQPHALIQLLKPLGFFDYISLQTQAKCVVSDSGTLSEESSILGFPSVHIRESYERPEGMEGGTLLLSNISEERLLSSIEIAIAYDPRSLSSQICPVVDYRNENVSKTVVKIISSHLDYIQRTVWHKNIQ